MFLWIKRIRLGIPVQIYFKETVFELELELFVCIHVACVTV